MLKSNGYVEGAAKRHSPGNAGMNKHSRTTAHRCSLQSVLLLLAGPLLLASLVAAQPVSPFPAVNPLRSETPDAVASAPAPSATADYDAEEELDGDDPTPAAGEQETYSKDQIQERIERIGTLNLSEDETAKAKTHYQEAMASAVELQQALKTVKDKNAEYQPVADPEHPQRPDKYSKEWYQHLLERPIEDILGRPADVTRRRPRCWSRRRRRGKSTPTSGARLSKTWKLHPGSASNS